MSESNTQDGKSRIEDGFLSYLVTLANRRALKIGITLTVQGVIISGTLIGYERYYNGILSKLENARVTGKSEDSGAEGHRIFMEHIEQMREYAKSEDPDNSGEITFVHLENAVIINDESRNIFPPNYWRVRRDSIDCFMLGGHEQLDG